MLHYWVIHYLSHSVSYSSHLWHVLTVFSKNLVLFSVHFSLKHYIVSFTFALVLLHTQCSFSYSSCLFPLVLYLYSVYNSFHSIPYPFWFFTMHSCIYVIHRYICWYFMHARSSELTLDLFILSLVCLSSFTTWETHFSISNLLEKSTFEPMSALKSSHWTYFRQ